MVLGAAVSSSDVPAAVPASAAPWEPCPDCHGACTTPGGGRRQAELPCGTCGATGLARLHDPSGDGTLLLPASSAMRPAEHHRHLAEQFLEQLDEPDRRWGQGRASRRDLLAQFLAHYEAFLRSAVA